MSMYDSLFRCGSALYFSVMLASFVVFAVVAATQAFHSLRRQWVLTGLMICSLATLITALAGVNHGLISALEYVANVPQQHGRSMIASIWAQLLNGFQFGLALVAVEATVLIVLLRRDRCQGAAAPSTPVIARPR